MCSPAKFLCEYVWQDCGISAVSPLSRNAAAWMHVTNTSEKRIVGDKFIFDVGLRGGVGLSSVPSNAYIPSLRR